MSKVIKKKIKIPAGMKDQNIAEMFNQMLGAGSINMNLSYPKYEHMKEIVSTLLDVIKMFNHSPFMKMQPEFAAERKEIDKFLERGRQSLGELFSMDLSDYKWNLNLVEDDQKKVFTEVYDKVKKSDLVNTFIIICDRLIIYKKYIGNADNLSYKFITLSSAAEICPFPFTSLNFKYIFTLAGLTETTKEFLIVVLNKIFTLSHNLYKEITSPDINVDEFVDVIMANIDQVKHQPGLSRCDKAFNKIAESVHMLKDNFNSYYRDFIESKSSTIIMEHFIIDVSKNTKADPQTTRQFRQIINYYRKMAQQQITNPKIKMLFDKFNENFKELERHTENLVNVKEDEEENTSEDEDLSEDSSESESDQIDLDIRKQNEHKTVDELVAEIEGKQRPKGKKE